MRTVRLFLVVSLVMLLGSTISYVPVSQQLQISNQSYGALSFKAISYTEIHARVIDPEVVTLSVFVLTEEDYLTSIREGSLVNTTPLANAAGASEISLLLHFPVPDIYGVLVETNESRTVSVYVTVSSIPPQLAPLVTGLILLTFTVLFVFIQKHTRQTVPLKPAPPMPLNPQKHND
ncbi:MAG: hypothetical protein HXY34_02480 [Candidatus Thorarchaeota archaeon]|nr:hypothetical protein [Candidatus Thorarchaeota archaeon]